MTGYSSDTQGLLGINWLTTAVKKNPEGWLLLGAACALLLRNGSANGTGGNGRDSQAHSSRRRGSDSWSRSQGLGQGTGEGIGDRVGEMADKVTEKVSSAARSYGDQISGKASEISDMASEYSTKAGDYMHSAQDRLRQQSDRLSEEGQVWMDKGSRMLNENPLAIAALGFGAGALVAALLPPSETEERLIGPARDSLAGAAKEMGGRMLEAAKDTGGELRHVAEQRGLSGDGLKQTANELVGTLKDSLGKDSLGKDSGGKDSIGKPGDQASAEGTASDRSRHIQ